MQISIPVLLFWCLFAVQAWAAVGEQIPVSELPTGICRIPLESSDGKASSCSATLVHPKFIATAAHCVPAQEDVELTVLCPGQPPYKGQARVVQRHSGARPESLVLGDALRDLAVLEVSEAIGMSPLRTLASRQEIIDLLATTEECAIFGFGGGQATKISAQPQLRGVKVDPDLIEYDPGMGIVANIYLGDYSGLITDGDSGGSLSCANTKGEWIHIGIASASPLSSNYLSRFAPYYTDHTEIDLPGYWPSDEGRCLYAEDLRRRGLEGLDGLAKRARLELYPLTSAQLIAGFEDFRKGIRRAKKAWGELSSRGLSCRSFYEEMRSMHLSFGIHEKRLQTLVIGRIKSNPTGDYYIKPFTLIEIDRLNPDAFEFKRFRETQLERFRNQPNPYVVVDVETAPLKGVTVKSIEGEALVEADLYIDGPSENFLCNSNLLCARGTYKNVLIPIERLTRIKPQFE